MYSCVRLWQNLRAFRKDLFAKIAFCLGVQDRASFATNFAARNAANSGVILRWPFSCSIKLAGYPDTTAQENQQIQIEIIHMLSWTLMFLVVALIAALLGFTGIAGTAAGIARILFVIFVVMFLVSVIMGRKRI